MAPYDKWEHVLPIVIPDDILGIHQEECDEFEVRLLASCLKREERAPNSLISRWFKDKKKTKKQKRDNEKSRSVRFNENVLEFRIPHKEDTTPEEKSIMWVNCFDWQAMQSEKLRITRAVLIGHMSIKNPEHRSTLRGLESVIPELAFSRRDNIMASRSLVLREQNRARLEDAPLDADRLGEMYGKIVNGSRKAAYDRGIEDYHEMMKESCMEPPKHSSLV